MSKTSKKVAFVIHIHKRFFLHKNAFVSVLKLFPNVYCVYDVRLRHTMCFHFSQNPVYGQILTVFIRYCQQRVTVEERMQTAKYRAAV